MVTQRLSQVAWLPSVLHGYVAVAATITGCWVLYWWLQPPLPAWTEALLLAVLVCVLGLPHGALDHIAGRQWLAPRFGKHWFLVFNLFYLGLAGVVILGWLVMPVPWLVIMLVLSAWHFGSDDATPMLAHGWVRGLEIISRGSSVILLPMWLHTDEVTRVIAYLLPTVEPASLEAALRLTAQWLAPWSLAGLLVVMLWHARRWAGHVDPWAFHRDSLVEISAIILAFILLPPLLAFAVYFCAWHSMRQILLSAAQLDASGLVPALRCFVRLALLPTLAVIVVGAGLWIHASSRSEPVPLLVTLVIVTLFALTLPHMVLRAICRDKKTRRFDETAR